MYAVLSMASPHTSLSTVGDGTYQSIFYTTNQSRLRELLITESGSKITDITDVAPKSNTAAVRDKPVDDDPDVIRVFYQRGDSNAISEYRYTDAKGWKLEAKSIYILSL